MFIFPRRDNGANINEKDNDGTTALHLASIGGYFEIVQKLIKHGTELQQGGFSNVNERENGGWIALHLASAFGHLEIVQELINYSDFTIINNNKYCTASDVAKTEEIRQFIINYQLVPDIKEPIE